MKWRLVVTGAVLLLCGSCGDLELGFPGVTDSDPESIIITIPQGATNLNQRAYGANPRITRQGARVTWVNEDSEVHTVTSSGGGWDSGDLSPGERYTRIFDDAGAFPYYCKHHPNMTGTLQVERSSTPPPVTGPSASPAPAPTGVISPGPTPAPGVGVPAPAPTFPPTVP